MLMFCQTVLSINIPELFGFAFPHAVQLAESGRSLRDRRIGEHQLYDNQQGV